jgi:hypothetical protein
MCIHISFGSTPLHYCTKQTIAQHLIAFGARTLIANSRKKTVAYTIKNNEEAEAKLKVYIHDISEAEYKQRKEVYRDHRRMKMTHA